MSTSTAWLEAWAPPGDQSAAPSRSTRAERLPGAQPGHRVVRRGADDEQRRSRTRIQARVVGQGPGGEAGRGSCRGRFGPSRRSRLAGGDALSVRMPGPADDLVHEARIGSLRLLRLREDLQQLDPGLVGDDGDEGGARVRPLGQQAVQQFASHRPGRRPSVVGTTVPERVERCHVLRGGRFRGAERDGRELGVDGGVRQPSDPGPPAGGRRPRPGGRCRAAPQLITRSRASGSAYLGARGTNRLTRSPSTHQCQGWVLCTDGARVACSTRERMGTPRAMAPDSSTVMVGDTRRPRLDAASVSC